MHKFILGVNDLKTVNPKLAAEWNTKRNGNKGPEDYLPGSNKIVWWICSEGHEWRAQINSRHRGRGCPYCKGQLPIKGVNDLLSRYPNVAAEWHPQKNGTLKPDEVTYGSGKKVWWLGACGHEWQATIDHRIKGRGCPICRNRIIIPGLNDLATINPSLAAEWHPTKNGSLTPDLIAPNARAMIWWVCKYGHEWIADLHSRASGVGCPQCAQRIQSSFPEQAILFYIQQVFPDTESRTKEILKDGLEIDIYIPSLKIGIEYDGSFWHNNAKARKKEERKYAMCKALGIRLIRIKEGREPSNGLIADMVISISSNPNYQQSTDAIKSLMDALPISDNISIDVERDQNSIKSNYITNLEADSLAVKNPELVQEWNKERNLPLTPDMVSPGSNQKVWWKCPKGHEWQAVISNRTKGIGCPMCSGQLVITGINDLLTLRPDIASEWDYERNTDLLPSQVMTSSGKKVWWKCKRGHEWEAPVYNRTSGHGCPYCAGNLVIIGENDLETLFPEIAAEWHPTKNGALMPKDVSCKSNRVIWWQCSKEHVWKAPVYNRTDGHGCPYCSGRRVLTGTNDLLTLNPALASSWHPSKNGGLTPSTISQYSNKKVWWQCPKGHEWQDTVSHRTMGRGCPYCSGRRVQTGVTDLATLRPEVLSIWDYERNEQIKPTQVGIGSHKKVWWKCSKGHEWQATIYNQQKSVLCPICKREEKKN